MPTWSPTIWFAQIALHKCRERQHPYEPVMNSVKYTIRLTILTKHSMPACLPDRLIYAMLVIGRNRQILHAFSDKPTLHACHISYGVWCAAACHMQIALEIYMPTLWHIPMLMEFKEEYELTQSNRTWVNLSPTRRLLSKPDVDVDYAEWYGENSPYVVRFADLE